MLLLKTSERFVKGKTKKKKRKREIQIRKSEYVVKKQKNIEIVTICDL